jgi:hypothetical protein
LSFISFPEQTTSLECTFCKLIATSWPALVLMPRWCVRTLVSLPRGLRWIGWPVLFLQGWKGNVVFELAGSSYAPSWTLSFPVKSVTQFRVT